LTSFRGQRTLGLLLSRKRTDWVYKPSLQFWREPFLARDRYIFPGTSLFTRPITSMENFHESGEEIIYDSPGSSETDKSDTDSHDIFENLLGPASPFGSPFKTYYFRLDSWYLPRSKDPYPAPPHCLGGPYICRQENPKIQAGRHEEVCRSCCHRTLWSRRNRAGSTSR
jgi:hypothetical protein